MWNLKREDLTTAKNRMEVTRGSEREVSGGCCNTDKCEQK